MLYTGGAAAIVRPRPLARPRDDAVRLMDRYGRAAVLVPCLGLMGAVVTASIATGALALVGAGWTAWWLPRLVPRVTRLPATKTGE